MILQMAHVPARWAGVAVGTARVIALTINADWRLESDELQWILKRRVEPRKEDGRAWRTKQWRVERYYRTVDEALMALPRKMPLQLTGDYDKKGLEPLLDTLDAMRADYKAFL